MADNIIISKDEDSGNIVLPAFKLGNKYNPGLPIEITNPKEKVIILPGEGFGGTGGAALDGKVSLTGADTRDYLEKKLGDEFSNDGEKASLNIDEITIKKNTAHALYADFSPVLELVNENTALIEALMYKDATVSLSLSLYVFEFGLTVNTAVTASWTVTENSDKIIDVDITNLTAPFSESGSQVKEINISTTFKITVVRTQQDDTARPNLVLSKTATATVPKFWGVSNSNTYPDTNPYTDLNKLIQTSGSISQKSFTANNQYGWFISTKSGATVFDQNGFNQTTWVESPITLVLPNGNTAQAYKYVSPEPMNEINFGLRLD